MDCASVVVGGRRPNRPCTVNGLSDRQKSDTVDSGTLSSSFARFMADSYCCFTSVSSCCTEKSVGVSTTVCSVFSVTLR
jgi:hypothetical protein